MSGPSGPADAPGPAASAVPASLAGPAELRHRVEEVWERVAAAGGEPERITLVAVTKGFGSETALAAAEAGLADLGENYAQELVAKAPELAAAGREVRWHAIGRLQRNKVRLLAPLVHLWQSVDSEPLGAEIARRAPGASVLVQVNVSGEGQKGGCTAGAAPDLVARLGDLGLHVGGLMTVGATGTADDARRGFADLGLLADRLHLSVRSMGMSGDFEVAVAEGATMVRLGTTLFGARPSRGRA